MIYADILGTDLRAGKLILGGDAFGSTVSKETAFQLLDAFIEAGGNMVDTANVYADWASPVKSISEKTIGEWMASRGCRENMVVTTKGGHPDCSTMHDSRMTREEIVCDLENSLRNLKTDRIDLYWLHKDDESIPVESLIDITDSLVHSGKVRYIGVSNWRYDRIRRANAYAAKTGRAPILASQIQYSIGQVNYDALPYLILGMSPHDEEYDRYCADSLNMFAYSAQAKGFFSMVEKGNGSTDFVSDDAKNSYLNEENLATARRLMQYSKENGTTVAALVIAALVQDTRLNTFAQVGIKTIERLKQALMFSEIVLSQKEIDALILG